MFTCTSKMIKAYARHARYSVRKRTCGSDVDVCVFRALKLKPDSLIIPEALSRRIDYTVSFISCNASDRRGAMKHLVYAPPYVAGFFIFRSVTKAALQSTCLFRIRHLAVYQC